MRAPLCSGVWAEWTRCATTILEEPTLKMSKNEEVPQHMNGLLPAQHQTGETPLGWVNRKLCAFLRMFSGVSLLDLGWKVWCRGKGMCGCQCQHSGGWGTDHTDEVWKIPLIMISSIPPLLILEIASLKHSRVWNGNASPCIDLWDDHSILNTDAKETPGISYVRDPYHYCSTPVGQGTLLHKLTWIHGGTHWEGVSVSHPPWFESVKLFGLSNPCNTWHERQNFV